MNINKFTREYPCTDSQEKEYLLSKGIRYNFVKVIDGITVWKFTKTPKLFMTLAEYIENSKDN